MTDLISRADAIDAVRYLIYDRQEKGAKPFKWWFIKQRLNAIPSAELPKGDLISRADAIEAVCDGCVWYKTASCEEGKEEWECSEVNKIRHLPSADAEPKWNCTANFVAEQLDRLRKMTDEEKWNFFRKFFGMGDAVHGEWEFVDNEIFAGEYFCSVCGKRAEVDLYGEWILSNYCPSCGAIMKGGAE